MPYVLLTLSPTPKRKPLRRAPRIYMQFPFEIIQLLLHLLARRLLCCSLCRGYLPSTPAPSAFKMSIKIQQNRPIFSDSLSSQQMNNAKEFSLLSLFLKHRKEKLRRQVMHLKLSLFCLSTSSVPVKQYKLCGKSRCDRSIYRKEGKERKR